MGQAHFESPKVACCAPKKGAREALENNPEDKYQGLNPDTVVQQATTGGKLISAAQASAKKKAESEGKSGSNSRDAENKSSDNNSALGNSVIDIKSREGAAMLEDIRSKASVAARSRIVRNATVYERYTVERGVLGNGLSGVVRTVSNKINGRKSAMKTLRIKNMSTKKWEMMYNEVDIYLKLDHPFICRLQEVYEDTDAIHLIMELCSGKELYERLAQKKSYTEKDTIISVQHMLKAIQYLHKNNFCHRDLKLENWVYADESEDAQLKLIDFGFSQVFSAAQPMTAVHGTVYYVAPEVLAGQYDHKCDIWSTGVITYMLLSGAPPFNGPNDPAIVSRIKKRKFDFQSKRWNGISEDAKDFITQLLTDASTRPSATECLELPWLQMVKEYDVPIDTGVLGTLKDFSKMNAMSRAALSVVASTMSSEGIRELEEQFKALDKSGDGKIEFETLKSVMKQKLGLSATETKKIFDTVSVAGSSTICYTDFLAACVQSKLAIDDYMIKEAFIKFDTEGKGYITAKNLRDALGETFNNEPVDSIIKRIDKTGTGKIDFSQFKDVMVMTEE